MHELDVIAMKPCSRQAPCHIGTRVDTDTKAEIFGLPPRGVAVHDDTAAKYVAGSQEFVANPKHVRLGLKIQGHARPHASMYEVVVTAAIAQAERTQKIVMCLGKHSKKGVANPLRLDSGGQDEFVVHAVTDECFRPAQAPIDLPQLRIHKEVEQHLFVVSFEGDRLEHGK